MADFQDPKQEWRRLFSELFGTFFLVLVAAGGGMMGQAFPETISRTAAVVAPGLMVMAIILFMGKVSGAHLNPAVSLAFSLRGDFPWRRVPGLHRRAARAAPRSRRGSCKAVDPRVRHVSARTTRRAAIRRCDAFLMEAVLTLGLVSVILGTASGAQNIGIIGAIGVGAYIALAGLWGSPISGASMNPARTFGPDVVGGRLHASTGSTSRGRSPERSSRSASRSSSAVTAAVGASGEQRRGSWKPRSRNVARTKMPRSRRHLGLPFARRTRGHRATRTDDQSAYEHMVNSLFPVAMN